MLSSFGAYVYPSQNIGGCGAMRVVPVSPLLFTLSTRQQQSDYTSEEVCSGSKTTVDETIY